MIHNEDFLNMLDLTMMMFKLRGTPVLASSRKDHSGLN